MELLKLLGELHIDDLVRFFGIKEFLPSSDLLHHLIGPICRAAPIVCDDVVEAICGQHHGAFNESRLQVMATHEPGGTR